jgi:hypothetical protein
MALTSTWAIIEGIAAIAISKVFKASPVFVFSNLNTWGWIVLGLLLVLVSSRCSSEAEVEQALGAPAVAAHACMDSARAEIPEDGRFCSQALGIHSGTAGNGPVAATVRARLAIPLAREMSFSFLHRTFEAGESRRSKRS